MRTRGVLSAVALMLVGVVALTTASLAWFVYILFPEVDAFQVNIIAGDSLQIGLTADGAFSNTLYKDDLMKGQGNAYFPAKIAPETSEGINYRLNAATPAYDPFDPTKLLIENGQLKFKKITAAYDIHSTSENIIDAEDLGNDFIQLKLYLRSNAAMNISLKQPQNIFTTTEVIPLFQITKALRLAVVFRKVLDPKAAIITYDESS